DRQVVLPAVDTDDHALVERLSVTNEQPAALLEVVQGIRQRLAGNHGYEHAVVALRDRSGNAFRVLLEDVIDETGARRSGEKFGAEADESPGWNAVVHANAALAIGHDVEQLSLAVGQSGHHRALVRLV